MSYTIVDKIIVALNMDSLINNIPVDSRDDVESIYNQSMRSSDADKVMFITGFYPTGKKVYYAVDLSDDEQ